MKKIIITGFITIFVFALTAYYFKTKSNDTISIIGECITTSKQDRTAIDLRVKTLAKTSTESIKKANKIVDNMMSFFKDKDFKIQTKRFDSYEKTKWDNKTQESKTIGIETNIVIEVSADSLEKLESVLNKFSNEENIFFDNFKTFSSSELIKENLEKCLGEATNNAKERAEKIAISQKRKIGRLINLSYITNNDYESPRFYSNFMNKEESANAMDDDNFGASLVSKETIIKVQVHAIFKLK